MGKTAVVAGSAMAGAPVLTEEAPLPASVIAALNEALEDELTAIAVYRAALDKLGDMRPFSNIIEAEYRHAEALRRVFSRYGVTPTAQAKSVSPEDLPNTRQEMCEVGVTAEIENLELYNTKLLPAVTSYPDIAAVMTNLRNASRDRHLPAFQRCASGRGMGGKPGGGRGRRRAGV